MARLPLQTLLLGVCGTTTAANYAVWRHKSKGYYNNMQRSQMLVASSVYYTYYSILY